MSRRPPIRFPVTPPINGAIPVGAGVGVLDRFGREITEGDLVCLPALAAPIGRVVQIRPAVHPNAPPNAAIVSIVVEIHAATPQGVPINEYLLVVPKEGQPQPEGAPETPPTSPLVTES